MTLILPLVVLALLDSTSIGTLFVPVLLMLAPGRGRTAPLVGYLVTIAVFYLALGVLVALVARPLLAGVGDSLGETGYWLELGAGVVLLVLSFRSSSGDRPEVSGDLGKKWTERVHKAAGSPRALVVLALTAGLVEAATMFPYLGAVAMVATAGHGTLGIAGVLAAYCLVMVLPALTLLGLRAARSERATPTLTRVHGWFDRNAVGATGWVLGIVGFLLAVDAVSQLGFLDTWRAA
ncbi:GAP family protein [Actinophytocola oryzae]|uniref:Sap-like sulfolipid-1-addressing protein n=1 Tax=Actinophytocola oryzae TaxID=502181 RepID=A0A4R7UZM4_9PSEU|nr:GAP family protein [Actinophytocola oryzae]TDV41714.1 Sap-like sulfolipid-1-addressing protein [Actinophytocola oryzae]